MPKTESALVILVPEAEPLVQSIRQRFDPSAAMGVPAHITLLYPFAAPEQIDAETIDTLTACFRGFAPIAFSLTGLRRFPTDTLYLSPAPDEPFRQLTLAIWERFPETPPYGGKWPNIVPHLSVRQFADPGALARTAGDLARDWAPALPIRAHAASAVLLVNTTGRWTVKATFKLGG